MRMHVFAGKTKVRSGRRVGERPVIEEKEFDGRGKQMLRLDAPRRQNVAGLGKFCFVTTYAVISNKKAGGVSRREKCCCG